MPITHFVDNRSPSLTDILKVNGAAVDLTGSTVKLKMRLEDSATLKVNAAATVTDAPNGAVQYDWATDDVNTAGTYLAWWEVTLPGGRTQETPVFVVLMVDHTPAQVTAYIDREDLKATLSMTGQTFADGDIDDAILAASRGVDNACERRFYPDIDANQVRYYTPSSASILKIDDLVTLTSLKQDLTGDGTYETTWTQGTDFVLEPTNAAADGNPYEYVQLGARRARWFMGYPREIEVTGKFGWAAPPEPVKKATSIIATRLLRRDREAPFGVVGVGFDGQAIRLAKSDPDIMFLLEPYSRRLVFA